MKLYLEVLDLQWYATGPKYHKLFQLASFLFRVLFLHACSVVKVVREPQLSEWTKRASRCDRLKSSVGLLIILATVSNTESTLLAYI
jgi:hypothetical protein